MPVVLALTLVVVATLAVAGAGRLAARAPLSVSGLHELNMLARHQLLLLGLAGLVLLAAYGLNPTNFLAFIGPGTVDARVDGVPWLGIPDGASWLAIGTSLALSVPLVTVVLVVLQLRKSGAALRHLVPHLPWVLLFALTNSFAEEAVYRLGVIVPLAGVVQPHQVLLVSAIAFGAAQLLRPPGGLVVALTTGLLGWLLAKSVVETHGVFWAWLIHFLQDVVVFSAFVMTAARTARGPMPGARAPVAG